MPQDANQKRKRRRRASWVEPFIEKVTEVVHRVVPEHLVPVFFAGALVVVLVLFLFVIIGFSRNPGEVANKRVENLAMELGCDVEELIAALEAALRDDDARDDSAAPHRTTPPPPVRPVASSGGGRWGGGGWGGGSYRGRTRNDDRSDSMNPNNAAFNASPDNRANQLNPNNPAYHSSRGRK